MSASCITSCHLLDLPARREEYRRARSAILKERGWLTRAGETACVLLDAVEGGSADAPVRPEPILPGLRFHLVDRQAGCAYPLRVGLNTIGRLPDNDVVLDGERISRRHCMVLVHVWDGCELHDAASLNGTFVNDQRIQAPVRVQSGDRIGVYDRPLLLVNERDYRSVFESCEHPATLP